MASTSPVYRKVSFPVNKELEVKPLDGFAACVLVDKTSEGAVLRLYVANSDGSPNVAAVHYTPKGVGNFCILDIPHGNTLDLDQILVAINEGEPVLPDPPVTWHT